MIFSGISWFFQIFSEIFMKFHDFLWNFQKRSWFILKSHDVFWILSGILRKDHDFFWFSEAVQRHFEHCYALLWDQKCSCRFTSGLCLWKNRLRRYRWPVLSYFLGSKSELKSQKRWNLTIPKGNGKILFSHPR